MVQPSCRRFRGGSDSLEVVQIRYVLRINHLPDGFQVFSSDWINLDAKKNVVAPWAIWRLVRNMNNSKTTQFIRNTPLISACQKWATFFAFQNCNYTIIWPFPSPNFFTCICFHSLRQFNIPLQGLQQFLTLLNEIQRIIAKNIMSNRPYINVNVVVILNPQNHKPRQNWKKFQLFQFKYSVFTKYCVFFRF